MYFLLFAFSFFLTISFWEEPNFFVFILLAVTLFLMLFPGIYASYIRRLVITEAYAELARIGKRERILLRDIRQFGIVKYRSFNFIYVSKLGHFPFPDPEAPVISSADTFVIQYRKGPWKYISSWIHTKHPEMQPVITDKNFKP